MRYCNESPRSYSYGFVTRQFLLVAFALAFACVSLSAPAVTSPADESTTTSAETNGTTVAAVIDDGLVECNLKAASIDRVIEFICEHTGKPVVKMKKVVAELTIVTPGRIEPARALDLIYEALLREGFAVIESEDRIQLVPVEEVKQQDIMTISGDIPPDIAAQRSRLIRKVIDLKHAKADVVKSYIEPLLGKHAAVTPDNRTNQLIITDIVRNVEQYETMIRALDAVGFDQMQVKIIPVVHGDATEISALLKTFATGLANPTSKAAAPAAKPQPGRPPQPNQKGAPPAGAGPGAIIMPETRTNSIVVAAPLEQMERILELLAQLDVEKPQEVDIHLMQIEFADASEIADSVGRVIKRNVGKSLKDTIEITPTSRENALLILASERNFKMIEGVVKTLDTEEAQKQETRTYVLEHLDAEDTATELSDLYGSLQDSNPYYGYYSYSSRSRGSNSREAKFVAVARTNSLLVVAAPSEFETIEGLIKELDQPILVDDILPKIYYIENANAKDVEKVLNTVFDGEKKEERNLPYYYYDSRGSDTKKSVTGRLSGKVSFSADENTNSIIAITNNKLNYEIVDEMIAKLDIALPSLANTIVIPLEYESAVDLAMALNNLFGTPVKPPAQQKKEEEEELIARIFYNWGGDKKGDERPISSLIDRVRVVAHERTNSLMITAASHHFPVIQDLVASLDMPEPQVLVRIRVLEVKRGDSKKLGLRWTPDPSLFSPDDLENAIQVIGGLQIIDEFGGAGQGPRSASSSLLKGASYTQPLGSTNGIISSTVNLDLLLQLLLKNTDSQIIIQPDLYVNNNQKGRIFVGDNVPRVASTEQTPQGGTNVNVNNEDIGIDMEVTPKINEQDVVMMKVHLVTSQLSGQVRLGSDIVQKREYETEVGVKSGETMVLGGIRLSTEGKTVRKMPILGYIPILGYLFRSYDINNQSSDLYAFISPVVVDGETRARAVVKDVVEDAVGFDELLKEPLAPGVDAETE